MKKPVYNYPNFVKKVELEKTKDKRFWLKLTIDESKRETIIVILKNPSRANKEVSDKTVYNVLSYLYKNRDKYGVLSNVKSVIIVNLIPHYQTYSNKLESLKNDVVCADNLDTIKRVTAENSNVLIAWGNPPKGLCEEYKTLKNRVLKILSDNDNKIFYVDKFSFLGNPKHGQIWGYSDQLHIL